MADELFEYYNQELLFLRRMGAEFAEQHPAEAGALRMSADRVDDPHVARLLQGVAFLNARTRRKIDDEFPELTDALLEQLYPHYLAPIPSMAIFAFHPARDLTQKRVLPAGVEVETESVGGEACSFRTAHPTEIWPIDIEEAALSGRPLRGPVTPRGGISMLRLTLSCMGRETTFAQLAPDSLRFFLRGSLTNVLRLYELIFNNTMVVAIAEAGGDKTPLLLDRQALRPVGFGSDEALLPYRARSAVGYQLLTEYFAFPQKFLFVEITGLAQKLRTINARSAEIYLYFNRGLEDLEGGVNAESFALGCAPVVNLFSQRAEAVLLNQRSSEYPIVPDSRRPAALEVYSVDDIVVTSQAGHVQQYEPFFGLKHTGGAALSGYWQATRRASGGRTTGTDTWLSFVDLKGDRAAPSEATASIQTTCTNRDWTAKLPFGAGRPHLRLVQAVPGIAGVTALTAPTLTLRLPNRKGTSWRLISHLTLNHLSLADQERGAEALKEVLRLYDFRDDPETQATIDTILRVTSRRGTARAPEPGMGALCRGLDITIEFDEQRSDSGGIYLLAAVLERFVSHYASINSFTRLTAAIRGRTGVLRTWKPRAGDLVLL